MWYEFEESHHLPILISKYQHCGIKVCGLNANLFTLFHNVIPNMRSERFSTINFNGHGQQSQLLNDLCSIELTQEENLETVRTH